METLESLTHSNVVRLVGVCVQDRPWLIVLELMPYGDLRKVLQAIRGKGELWSSPRLISQHRLTPPPAPSRGVSGGRQIVPCATWSASSWRYRLLKG